MSSTLTQSVDLPRVLRDHFTLGYFEVSAFMLILFDYSLTVNDEIQEIWSYSPKSKRSVTVLYVINRYLPIIAQAFNVYSHMSPSVTFSVSEFAVAYWLIGTSIFQLIVTDSIVWLSVCALYGNKKAVRYPLFALFVLSFLGAVIVVGAVGKHTKGTNEPAPGIKECFIFTPYKHLWLFWVPIFVYEITTLGLVARKFYDYFTRPFQWTSSLLEGILQVTFTYLGTMLGLFIGECLLFASPDPQKASLLNPITLVMLSIFGNRMLFMLRKQGRRIHGAPEGETEVNLETLHFHHSHAVVDTVTNV
ncbi:hypothetical protein CPC08DRAFT_700589 [Agrocybe pediades]|nr:hypothetical protein CPC08DRAFT_700589 [Agrocybe pediades]